MKTVKGDLLWLGRSGVFDVIIHGCNCFNTMGAGIARSVMTHFPEAYAVDLTTEVGALEKLGTYTWAEVDCYVDDPADANGNFVSTYGDSNRCRHHKLTVVNAYTQWLPAGNLKSPYGDQCEVDYDAVRFAFRRIRADFAGKKLAYPLIGAGLGEGDWNIIARIIDEELRGEDHTLVVFQP